MYCENCGNKINDGENFCGNCGAKREFDEKGQKRAAECPTMEGNNVNKNKNRKYAKRIVAVFFVITAVFCVAVLIKYIVSNDILSDIMISHDLSVYTPDIEKIRIDEKTGINYIDNMVIIFFREDVSEKQRQEIFDNIGGTVKGNLGPIDQYQVEVSDRTLPELKDLCDQLESDERIEAAMYDYISFENENVIMPDDPWTIYDKKIDWDEKNLVGNNWWIKAIQAPSAWEHFPAVRKRINIGIVDSGFDVTHEDLQDRIIFPSNIDERKMTGFHGTAVAGIIGAIPDNKKGITGIVPNCRLICYPVKTLSDDEINSLNKKSVTRVDEEELENYKKVWINSETISTKLAGLVYTVVNGAKVVNFSNGYREETLKKLAEGYEDDFLDTEAKWAAIYMAKLLAKSEDFLVVQSAGNDGQEASRVGTFARIREDLHIENQICVNGEMTDINLNDLIKRIIVVGAAKNDGHCEFSLWERSARGERVDIFAPGVQIYTTVPSEPYYGEYDGTSLSAPIVTGVAALVWQLNKDLDGAGVKEIVCAKENTIYKLKNTDESEDYRLVNAKLATDAALDKLRGEDWKQIYKKFLSEYTFDEKDNNFLRNDPFLTLLDLDGDDIPELLYQPGNSHVLKGGTIDVFAIENGEVQYKYEGPRINPDAHQLYRDRKNKKNLLISGYGRSNWYGYFIYDKNEYYPFLALDFIGSPKQEFSVGDVGSDGTKYKKVSKEQYREYYTNLLKGYKPMQYSFEENIVEWHNSMTFQEKTIAADELVNSYIRTDNMANDSFSDFENRLMMGHFKETPPDNNQLKSGVVFSSSIGEADGKTYAVRDVKSLDVLPVNTHGKEISSFCEYGDYIYYILTDGGSDGYSTWLYRCTDKWNDEELLDNINFNEIDGNGERYFVIDDNVLYYDTFGEDREVTCIHLVDMSKDKAVCPKYRVNNNGVTIERIYSSNCNIYICNDVTYFTDADRNLYKLEGSGGTLIAQNAFLDGGYSDGYLYYAEYDISQPGTEVRLYKIPKDGGKKKLVDTRMPAGGGGPFFCW